MMVTVLTAALLLLQEPDFPSKPIAPIKMTDVSGAARQVPDGNSKLTVLIFLATDCPIANRYAPEMKRIMEDYTPKGVTFFRVYADASVPVSEIRKHTEDYGYVNSALFDSKHQLVKSVGASVTPQTAVLTNKGKLIYRGRINDLYLEHGRFRDKANRDDLKIALDEALAGKAVSVPITRAIGCDIPDF